MQLLDKYYNSIKIGDAVSLFGEIGQVNEEMGALGYKAGILDNSIIEMKASFFKPNIWLNMCIEYIILCV